MTEASDSATPEEGAFEEPSEEASANNASSWWSDIVVAFLTLTSIPVPAAPRESRPAETALRGFPVIGALVGLIGGLSYIFFILFGLTTLAAAGVAMGIMIWATGAMHERSLAGFTSTLFDPHENDIETDSVDSARGTLSVVTLSLSLLVKVALIAQIGASQFGSLNVLAVLIAVSALSRTVMVSGLYLSLKSLLTEEGSDPHLWKQQRDRAFQAFIVAAIIAVLFLGSLGLSIGIVAVLAVGLGAYWVYWLSGSDENKPLDSNTLGSMQQVSELTALVVIAALLNN